MGIAPTSVRPDGATPSRGAEVGPRLACMARLLRAIGDPATPRRRSA
jgi:hypothetical protein